jgi:glycosyltransferase involved in cell wall biosynthesis
MERHATDQFSRQKARLTVRVLNVNASLDPISGGGTAERTVQMSRYMVRSGLECGILTTNVGLTPAYVEKLDGIELLACECLWKRFFIPKDCLGSIKKSIGRADIVHLMGHWSVLNVLAYFFLRRLRKPYVVCPAGSLPIYGRSKILKRAYNALLGNRIMRNASGVIAVTDGDKQHMGEYGVSEDKVVVIPNGVSIESRNDGDAEEFRKKHGLGEARILLFMGRLNHIKGPDLLLRAFCNVRSKFPDCVLVFAGPDGRMPAEMESYVTEHDASGNVRFVGYLGEVEKVQAYRSAELLIIPSRQEPMSIVVLEAGREGIPVMVTDKCDFDVIEEVGGGIVVEASVSGLESGLSGVLDDRQHLAGMGMNLRRYVQDHFSWDVIVRRYIALYERIVNSR